MPLLPRRNCITKPALTQKRYRQSAGFMKRFDSSETFNLMNLGLIPMCHLSCYMNLHFQENKNIILHIITWSYFIWKNIYIHMKGMTLSVISVRTFYCIIGQVITLLLHFQEIITLSCAAVTKSGVYSAVFRWSKSIKALLLQLWKHKDYILDNSGSKSKGYLHFGPFFSANGW